MRYVLVLLTVSLCLLAALCLSQSTTESAQTTKIITEDIQTVLKKWTNLVDQVKAITNKQNTLASDVNNLAKLAVGFQNLYEFLDDRRKSLVQFFKNHDESKNTLEVNNKMKDAIQKVKLALLETNNVITELKDKVNNYLSSDATNTLSEEHDDTLDVLGNIVSLVSSRIISLQRQLSKL